MASGNTPRTAICCAAASPRVHTPLRGHPLESCAHGSGRREGENRGAMVHVLLRTRISGPKHPGRGVQIFQPSDIREVS